MDPRHRGYLVNTNRVVILALTLTGLLMDGFQAADLPITLALLVWLWLSLCVRVEAKLLARTRRHPERLPNHCIRSHRNRAAVSTKARYVHRIGTLRFGRRGIFAVLGSLR